MVKASFTEDEEITTPLAFHVEQKDLGIVQELMITPAMLSRKTIYPVVEHTKRAELRPVLTLFKGQSCLFFDYETIGWKSFNSSESEAETKTPS